jgi:hypothetical protein
MYAVNVLGRILATLLRLWIGLAVALIYFTGWQIAILVLSLGLGATLIIVSFPSHG